MLLLSQDYFDIRMWTCRTKLDPSKMFSSLVVDIFFFYVKSLDQQL